MILKHALKTAVAAGILAALFQNSDLTHVQYPVMGLIATMLTSVGDTVKAGWGRLGGSAVAGVFATLILSVFGSNPIAGGIVLLLASLFCELLGWKALVSQVGVFSALIVGEPALGKDPGLYTIQRIWDNGIGVFVATAVTLFFWPERPRQILQKHLSQILEHTDQCFQQIIQGGEIARTGLEQRIAAILQLAKASETLLERSLYGFLGRQLVQDNWSDLIARERRLRRHLLAMTRILREEHKNPLLVPFTEELEQLAHRVSTNISAIKILIQRQRSNRISKSEIPPLEQHLSAMMNRLDQMRHTGEIRNYPLHDVIHFYDFLSSLTRLIQELDQLAIQLQTQNHRTSPIRFSWKLSLHSIPIAQIKHYLKVAIALGLTLAIANFFHLEYGYYVALSLVVAMQPTLGKGIDAGKQRVLGTGIGALVAIALVNTLGSHPFTVALGVALTMLGCDYFGMTSAGYKGGCFLVAIALMVHSSEPNSYIWGRFFETLLGILIAMLFSILLPPQTATAKINPGLHQTFNQLARLYEEIMETYLTEQDVAIAIDPLIEHIRQGINLQTALQSESKVELIDGFRSAILQRRWNFMISYERTLFSSILSLQHVITQAIPGGLKQLFLPELEDVKQQNMLAIKAIAGSLDLPPNSHLFTALLIPLQAIEQKLENLRSSGVTTTYEMSEVISFFGILSALREISENLEQMSKHWPEKQSS